MKDEILIVGAGGFGRVVLEHLNSLYQCFFVDDNKEKGAKIDGAEVVGTTNDLEELFLNYKCMVLAIGNNEVRKDIYDVSKKIGYTFPNIIDNSVYISPHARVGEGCIILNNAVIQNGSKIGNATIINPGVEIHHDSSVGNFCCIYTNSVIRTYSNIKDCVKIGSNVTVKNETIVTKNIDDGVTI